MPGIHIRTTMITGHPGETEEDFAELEKFVRQQRFERLGVFAYSHEDDTYAFRHYEDNVPEEVKQERADRIMSIQEGISAEVNQAKVGKTMRVMIDRREGDHYIGRTEFDSPEVDPEVVVNGNAEIGQFRDVKITGAEDYDLIGEAQD